MTEALNLGNKRVFNVIILGILSKHMDLDESIWKDVIRKTVPEKTIDINIQAFEKGRELVEDLGL